MSARFRGPVGRQLAPTLFIHERGMTVRKALLVGAVCISVLSLFASPASAQQPPLPGDYFNNGKAATLGPKPVPTANPVQVGETPKTFPKVLPSGDSATLCKGTIHSKRGRRCATYKGGRLTKVCTVRAGRGKTCRLFNKNGQVFRICVTRPGEPTRCRSIKTAQTLQANQTIRNTLGLNSHGFGTLMPAVGAVWTGDLQICSGTLIGPGVVLTAAHCLYENDLAGQEHNTTFRGYQPNIGFAPGQSFNTQSGLTTFDYGFWPAENWWVPQGWVNNDDGMDWGLIKLLPDASGNYPGNTTGWWTALANISYSAGAHAYLTGYPGMGVFGTPSFYYGRAQYFCDSTWDQYAQTQGSNVALTYSCNMSGGASGGPVFVELSDGSWVIGGVNNRALYDTNAGYSHYTHSAYFDNRLVEFYNAIFG